jgi:hypothetical protein
MRCNTTREKNARLYSPPRLYASVRIADETPSEVKIESEGKKMQVNWSNTHGKPALQSIVQAGDRVSASLAWRKIKGSGYIQKGRWYKDAKPC